MPPVTKPTQEKYDYVVIGGGSGASGTAVRSLYPALLPILSNNSLTLQRRAASYGKKVAVIEATGVLGGCCVKVGEYLFPMGKRN
jgi:glutathione reductase (NADPH)